MTRSEAIAHWTQRLTPQLPPNTAHIIALWIVDLNVEFVISKPRKTKLGDFRPKHQGSRAKITVNVDLNPYHFLVTTIHEFAHLGCYLKHQNTIAPHGQEWKAVYKTLLSNFLAHNELPQDLVNAIYRHLDNPSASSCSCAILSSALRNYDNNRGTLLQEIKSSQVFLFQDIAYRMIQKRRTRYLCERISDQKKYLISGQAKVEAAEYQEG